MVKNIISVCGIVLVTLTQPTHAAENNGSSWKTTATPKVIHDSGGTPIDPYLPKKHEQATMLRQNLNERRSAKLVHAHFPVVTTSMSVGQITSDEAQNVNIKMLSSAVFIIGYDPISIHWLTSNRDFLASKNAIGLVVNIENKEQMDNLQQIAGDRIRMQPTPGDRIAKHLNIQHYPFYMDSSGVMR
jgi:integrating conjugative element protein (TIGR03765 family)